LASGPFSAAFSLGGLDGTNGFLVRGLHKDDYCATVANAGDVNHDGISDILISAFLADPDGRAQAGQAYVVFGKLNIGAGGAFDLASLNGVNGFVINGSSPGDEIGNVRAAGDFNGDGIDDILIGARRTDPGGLTNAGSAYIVFGKNTGVAGPFDPVLTLSGLSGTNGFVLTGINAYDGAGWTVSTAGDVNGDGIDDVIIGATAADPNGQSSGQSYVVFGTTAVIAGVSLPLSSLNGTNGFAINGVTDSDRAGYVSEAGDLNADGFDDIVIGARGRDPAGRIYAGETYVVFGGPAVGSSGVIELSSLNGTNGFRMEGIDAGDQCGQSVAAAGDVNGDGIDDLLIGAFRASQEGQAGAGESYVVFGKPGIGASGLVDLSSLNGTTGIVIKGVLGDTFSGLPVASAGDVNADGINDILIAARQTNAPGAPDQFQAGAVYVIYGAPSIAPSGSITLASLNGTNGFVMYGIDDTDMAGWTASSAGDVNSDGIEDMMIGALLADLSNQDTDVGECYIVFGRAPQTCPGDVSGDGSTTVLDFNILAAWFGHVVTPGTNGDLNGDGLVNTADFNILAGNFGCTP